MTTHTTHGLAAIEAVFSQTRAAQRAAYIPYFPVGYPDYDTSLEALRGLARAGADIIEVGVPFSDPLADGPTIQAATQQALANGTTLQMCLDAVRQLRGEGIQTPMLLMGYLNPFIAYGYEALVETALDIGLDGFIVPDMPADEAGEIQTLIDDAGLSIVHLLAPTSGPDRIRLVADRSRGYIYLVSVRGITGARDEVPPDLVQNVAAIRSVTQTPIAVGFGIGTPQKAAAVGQIADGIIVGSALVKAAQGGVSKVEALARAMRQALDAAD